MGDITPQTESDFEELLEALFDAIGHAEVDEETQELDIGEVQDELVALRGCRVRSFSSAGLMTRNRGVVITAEDGHEWQLTIVQSK